MNFRSWCEFMRVGKRPKAPQLRPFFEQLESRLNFSNVGITYVASPFSEFSGWLEEITIADLDGDGDQDLVAGREDQLYWFEKVGPETFRPHRLNLTNATCSVTQHNPIWSFQIADLNLDGLDDLLVTTSTCRNNEYWFPGRLNSGPGPIPKKLRFAVRGTSIQWVDLDRDGDLDAVTTESGGSRRVFHNELERSPAANGRFTEQSELPYDFLLIDMNSDAVLDLLVLNNDGQWSLVLPGENGSVAQHPVPLPSRTIGDLRDVDGDGDFDILPDAGDRTMWIENDSEVGVFVEHLIDTNRFGHSEFVDIDNDGDLDLISEGSPFSWRENLGDRTFSEARTLMSQFVAAAFFQVFDIDDDGDLDVTVESSRSGAILLEFENGTFSQTRQFHFQPRKNLRIDLDEDGDLDWLCPNGTQWFDSIDDATLHSLWRPERVESVFSTDLNQDQAIDVIGIVGDELVWLENQYPNSGFASPVVLAALPELSEGSNVEVDRIFDVDQDGWLDLFYYQRREILHYELNNRGELEARPTLAGVGPRWKFADVDNDGDLDLLGSEGGVNIRENLGEFGFGESIQIANESTFARTIRADDFDNDGDLDVVAEFPSGLHVYENRGASGWFELTRIDLRTRTFEIADLNGDQFADILVADREHGFWLYRGVGDGSFRDAVQIAEFRGNARPGFFQFADVDFDDDLDIVLLNDGDRGYERSISWYENLDGLADFSRERTLYFDPGFFLTGPPQSLLLADFDLDGRQEFLLHRFTETIILEVDPTNGVIVGDLNSDRELDVHDVDAWCERDEIDLLTRDEVSFNLIGRRYVERVNLDFLVENMLGTSLGDVNGDGLFDSSDMVAVWQAAKFEVPKLNNERAARYSEGDWNCDGKFDTRDLVAAFQTGAYEVPNAVSYFAWSDTAAADLNHGDRKVKLIR